MSEDSDPEFHFKIILEEIEKSKIDGVVKVFLKAIVNHLEFLYTSDSKTLGIMQDNLTFQRLVVNDIKGMRELMGRMIDIIRNLNAEIKNKDNKKDIEEIKSQVEQLTPYLSTLQSLEEMIENTNKKIKEQKESLESDRREPNVYG